MNTWIRKVGMGAVALTLAGVLGGCNDGDGGFSGLVRLFFGINGNGTCTSITVVVDLDDADAVIARDNNGDVQCALNAILQGQGCEVEFLEANGNLTAVINGCSIPAVSNLFSCFFEDVDISDLQETASSTCQCGTLGCIPQPPVCISLDPDPTSCEICDNGVDDDGNGDTDCDDENCQNFPGCGITTTTVTTSTTLPPDTTTTTVTTSTTVTSTTSTTLGDEFNCTITFRVLDDDTYGALQWITDYGNAPGELVGSAGQVECASLVEGNNTLAAFNDDDLAETLDSGLVSVEGFTGPTNLSECTFRGNLVPDDSSFQITVTEASAPNTDPLPLPDIVVSNIDCDGGPPDTTTTTQPDGTTTTTEAGPTTTTTLGEPPLGNFNVVYTFATSSSSEATGALQWLTDYSGAPGQFQDIGGAVDCTSPIAGLFAPNDDDANQELTLGVISFTGFSPPTTVATCIFQGLTGTPVPGDFPITIQDATDINGTAITATITVTVVPIP